MGLGVVNQDIAQLATGGLPVGAVMVFFRVLAVMAGHVAGVTMTGGAGWAGGAWTAIRGPVRLPVKGAW